MEEPLSFKVTFRYSANPAMIMSSMQRSFHHSEICVKKTRLLFLKVILTPHYALHVCTGMTTSDLGGAGGNRGKNSKALIQEKINFKGPSPGKKYISNALL